MTKIYSRPRIRIPKLKLNRISKSNFSKNEFYNDKKKRIRRIILIFIIAFSTAKLVLDAVLPIFDNICESKAKSIATMISNEQATIIMKEHTYDELFKIERDKDENITMINANIIAINEIISDLAKNIQIEMDNRGKEEIKIPIGSFIGMKLLAGRGPSVKIAISPIGNVETDLKSDFIEQGINQTLHRVYLEVRCQMSILTPFNGMSKEITNQVLLAENMIIGNIPSNYYNFEDRDLKNNSLELIN